VLFLSCSFPFPLCVFMCCVQQYIQCLHFIQVLLHFERAWFNKENNVRECLSRFSYSVVCVCVYVVDHARVYVRMQQSLLFVLHFIKILARVAQY